MMIRTMILVGKMHTSRRCKIAGTVRLDLVLRE